MGSQPAKSLTAGATWGLLKDSQDEPDVAWYFGTSLDSDDSDWSDDDWFDADSNLADDDDLVEGNTSARVAGAQPEMAAIGLDRNKAERTDSALPLYRPLAKSGMPALQSLLECTVITSVFLSIVVRHLLWRSISWLGGRGASESFVVGLKRELAKVPPRGGGWGGGGQLLAELPHHTAVASNMRCSSEGDCRM